MTSKEMPSASSYHYLRPLFQRRDVLELGALSADDGAGARLLGQAGAQSVVALDHDATAVQRAEKLGISDHLRFARFDGQPGGGKFDLILVHDAFRRGSDVATALKTATALREGGWLVLLTPSAVAGLWLGPLQQQFRSVERAAAYPVGGHLVMPAGGAEVPVALERGRELLVPELELFICGERPARLVAGVLGLANNGGVRSTASSGEILSDLRQDLESNLEDDRLAKAENELQHAFEALQQAQLVAAQALAERDSLRQRLAGLERGETRPPVATSDESDGLRRRLAEAELSLREERLASTNFRRDMGSELTLLRRAWTSS